MPKKPKINASDRTWGTYEKKMNKYVARQNKKIERRELKEKLLSKIRV